MNLHNKISFAGLGVLFILSTIGLFTIDDSKHNVIYIFCLMLFLFSLFFSLFGFWEISIEQHTREQK